MRALAGFPALLVLALGLGCGDEEPPAGIPPTYEDVDGVLTRSCTFSGACHGGPGAGQGDLNFMATTDKTSVLNGVASCEYDRMPRVDPGDPDNSWLMVKIDGMHDDMGNIQFTPDADWVRPPDAGCDDFGTLMPQTRGMASPLPMDEVELIREWIRVGAPGPS